MSSLNSINNRLNKIKNDFLTRNPKNLLMFVEEDNLPIRIVDLQYNGKRKIVQCTNEKEWEELKYEFKDYEKKIFIKVKKPKPNDVAVANY